MDVVGISSEEQVSLQVISYRNNKFFKGEVSQKFVIFNLWFFTQEAIVRVLFAILLLGNIEFGKGKEIGSVV